MALPIIDRDLIGGPARFIHPVTIGEPDETEFESYGQKWLEGRRLMIRAMMDSKDVDAYDAMSILVQGSTPRWMTAYDGLVIHVGGAKTEPVISGTFQTLTMHTTGDVPFSLGLGGYAVHNGTGTIGVMAAVMGWSGNVEPGSGEVAVMAGHYAQRQHGGTLSAGFYSEKHLYTDPNEHAVYILGGRVSFIEGLTFLTKAGAPTAAQIPAGQYQVWKDSSSGALKLWANDGGTLKSVTLT